MSQIRGPGRPRDMRIAIAGGTGTLGSLVAAELAPRHEVRVLGRGAPKYRVDLVTGSGLADALDVMRNPDKLGGVPEPG